MSQLYKIAFAFVDAHSGLHTFIGAAGSLGLAVWRFSQNDYEGGAASLSLGLTALGIGMKQHATGGKVDQVVDATVDAPAAVGVPTK